MHNTAIQYTATSQGAGMGPLVLLLLLHSRTRGGGDTQAWGSAQLGSCSKWTLMAQVVYHCGLSQ